MRKFLVGTLLTIASLSSGAQAVATTSQNRQPETADRITVTFENTPVQEALWTISKRSGARIIFAAKMLPDKKVNYQGVNVATATALQAVLQGTGATYERMENGAYKVVRGQTAKGQGVISGKVTDAKTGRGISGTTVSIGNDARGVTTGEEGSYRLTGIAAGTHAVSVRLLGYVKQTRSVTVGEGATVTADFKLESSANVLDQVIVTGTVVQTELKAVPNAMTIITAKQIEERGITKIDQLFRGDIPGLFAQNKGSGALLDEVTMFSRGATALSSGSAGTDSEVRTNPIKTYVDGVEMADSRYISQIDPRSIERIEILTGPQASTIYGSNAINGVMQVFTKRGRTSRPQLTVNLASGWVENNFSNSRTPQHDYTGMINGIEGKISYSTGVSWNYIGPWTPAKQTSRTNVFGGARFENTISAGRFSVDMNIRHSLTKNHQRGATSQLLTGLRESGWYDVRSQTGLNQPTIYNLNGQTVGLSSTYAPKSWLSNEFVFGEDVENAETITPTRGYTVLTAFFSDTTLSISQSRGSRQSMRYTTTGRIPVLSAVEATVVLGADAWKGLSSSLSAQTQSLTGTMTGTTSISRQPNHNTGGFIQTQVGILGSLFLTYGLRAEWNPHFGDEALPNYSPRYGVAYTSNVGDVSAKLRASYGKATRPPLPKLKAVYKALDSWGAATVAYYGNFDYYLANPDLGPEYQQGGEGGIELYFGNRGSVVLTRYNQTIDGLIVRPAVDSVRSLILCPGDCNASSRDADGYGYIRQYQYLNVAGIRNQGWESQSSINLGPFTTRGTYTWTKSRVLGINPKYRWQFQPSSYPEYQPGATFQFLPEHTWALGITYSRSKSSIGFNLTGTGEVKNANSEFINRYISTTTIRLPQNRWRSTFQGFVSTNKAYSLADLIASHRIMPQLETVIQIQNLGDKYVNDHNGINAIIGRQTKAGLKWRI